MDFVPKVDVSQTKDGRWRVRIRDSRGGVTEEHVLDAEPSPESIRALMAEAITHHDALVRLVHR